MKRQAEEGTSENERGKGLYDETINDRSQKHFTKQKRDQDDFKDDADASWLNV